MELHFVSPLRARLASGGGVKFRQSVAAAAAPPFLSPSFPLDTSHAAGVENGKGTGDIEMAILRRVGEEAELGQCH